MPAPEDHLISTHAVANVAQVAIEDLYLLHRIRVARRILRRLAKIGWNDARATRRGRTVTEKHLYAFQPLAGSPRLLRVSPRHPEREDAHPCDRRG